AGVSKIGLQALDLARNLAPHRHRYPVDHSCDVLRYQGRLALVQTNHQIAQFLQTILVVKISCTEICDLLPHLVQQAQY
ncbi:MAG: hypothetical protein ACKOI2_08850, partial [Actinomycetota bacterium]